MQAQRALKGPMISPDTPGWDEQAVGFNINGPSLIRVPDWIPDPLGRYYLYFAHHQSRTIRLAHADELTGSWTIHTPGALSLDQTPFTGHIASPDVHVDPSGADRLIMIYHGCGGVALPRLVEQPAAVASSRDGLNWTHENVLPVESYLRAFSLAGRSLGVAKQGRLYEAEPGGFDFHKRIGCLDVSGRHWAVHVEDDRADFFYSRFGDAPEHILHFSVRGVDGPDGLENWHRAERRSILRPRHAWEGADRPITASRLGASHEPVHELRDPAVFQDADGERYLVYSLAGETGLGLATLRP